MSGKKAKAMFEQMKEKNMITEEILEYHDAGPVGVELSTGRFAGSQVWGVTVAILETGAIDHSMSQLHQTPESARRHIGVILDTYSC